GGARPRLGRVPDRVARHRAPAGGGPAHGRGRGAAARRPAAPRAAAAADAAEQGARDTVPLQARKGRASYLGERSIGHQDPGATSTALVFRTLADVTAT
ncbi:DAK2 domain-containing protein, partial [Kitasatospora sp. NPDC057512]|uniref:DAK2 domain-containing protein n=1 Tax=Kitasatospora sp. NPDC057512 TaxID=3346154 RepID=UPI0036AD0055